MPNYKNPPIIETVFDIHVELPTTISPDSLKELSSKIISDYPIQKPRHKFKAEYNFGVAKPAKSEAVDLGIDGYLNYSKDEKYIVQFRLDGYAFNRLAPYQGWNDIFPRAMQEWKLYSATLNPITIRRIVVRNINEILIPKTNFELEDYFTNSPRSPDNTQILNFFNRIECSPKGGGQQTKAVIIQTISNRIKPGITPIILDIELVLEIGKMIDNGSIELLFDQFHDLKNELFESCITDNTRKLFE